jgi:membrane fusion protein, heavy metal efflux system
VRSRAIRPAQGSGDMRKIVIALVVLALAAASGAALLSPDARTAIARIIKAAQDASAKKPAPHGHDHAHGREHGAEGSIKLSPEQIAKANIELAPAGKATLTRGISVPGTILPDADRIGRVAAKVVGTVAELRKRLGDHVAKGEVIAVLESREVADAKSEYLAAMVHFELQKTLFEREERLWSLKISAEQQFLRARNAFKEAELRVNLSRQKLSALDLTEAEISGLPAQPLTSLRQKEIRAPVTGQVVERRVDLGAPVGGEGHEKELYVIADLSTLWLELSVPMADLGSIKAAQPVTIAHGGDGSRMEGRIIFVSPLLNPETRNARVIASLENKGMAVRPGSLVTALIISEEQEVELAVPRTALQTIAGDQAVFVRTEEGFEKREIVVGRMDEKHAEVVFGLDPGETIAVTNTFVLKAELGKSEAEHGHAH